MITPLQREREKRGLTPQDIASAMSVHRTHICRVESGEMGASPKLAKRISEFFDGAISRDEILFPELYPCPTLPTPESEALPQPEPQKAS